jgi:putative transposase
MERLVRLTDAQWARVQPGLPSASKKGGRPGKPDRPMVEGMLWILRTGAPWRDLPSAYGPWQSVYTRFSRWSAGGVLARLFEALARERDSEGYLIDATIVRAHQDASGAVKEGDPGNRPLARRSVHEDPRPRGRSRQPGASHAFARTSA